MSFFTRLFGNKIKPANTIEQFWNWFRENERSFYDVIKNDGDVERDFFSKLTPKFDTLHSGIYALVGMMDDNRAEMILTADGVLKNIYFIEDLAGAAPTLTYWQITTLKPAQDIENVDIATEGLKFNAGNIGFYAKEHPGMPDEIDIVAVHDDATADNKTAINNGVYLFLDNYLGELNFINAVDNLEVCTRTEAEQPLIPIAKLKEYLAWREKEFVEKYAAAIYHNEHSEHRVGEATLANGRTLVMIVNSGLLKWEYRASHPWVLAITVHYEQHNNNGMPTQDVLTLLQRIDDDMDLVCRSKPGIVFAVRTTGDCTRELYFVCKDFRMAARCTDDMISRHKTGVKIDYHLYKDKYWRTFDRFTPN